VTPRQLSAMRGVHALPRTAAFRTSVRASFGVSPNAEHAFKSGMSAIGGCQCSLYLRRYCVRKPDALGAGEKFQESLRFFMTQRRTQLRDALLFVWS
jgi:hypothetical protein